MTLAQMLLGAVLSALAAGVVAGFLRVRRIGVLLSVAGAALVMPLCWNSILNWTGATGLFSHDLPFALFPVSWQDTGSGVFTLAGAGMVLMLGSGRNDSPRRLAALAGAAAAAALVVDVYFY
ncbi:hypothetical protein ASG92_01050 [Arthrobacter sp. Soil736]|uniref:hypothetical protein n=1 Tax=Arthrobacter sp. Soil736 TaxID=1736395 RepID=UPI0007007DCC|nr:hypothetical protein [Arthrobacter sp. Soil736]KRE68492.1 hypothetical protein ASG92_01050 [Arthrobacter sp. Soil736]